MMVRTCRYKMDATGRFSSKCFLEVRFLVADHGWQKIVRSRLTRQVFSTVWSDRAQSPCGARCLCKVEVWGREPAWWTSRFQSGEPEAAEIFGRPSLSRERKSFQSSRPYSVTFFTRWRAWSLGEYYCHVLTYGVVVCVGSVVEARVPQAEAAKIPRLRSTRSV
jgi:hypothetical protein